MKLTYQTPEKENWFLVSWTLANKCNYRCDYCPSFLHDGSSGWPEKEDVFDFVKSFDKLEHDKRVRQLRKLTGFIGAAKNPSLNISNVGSKKICFFSVFSPTSPHLHVLLEYL